MKRVIVAAACVVAAGVCWRCLRGSQKSPAERRIAEEYEQLETK